MVERQLASDGGVTLRSERCSFQFRRLRPGALVVTIEGFDSGEFGNAPFDELRSELVHFPPVELFLDLSKAFGAQTDVQRAWTQWFRQHQGSLRRVSVLSGSKFIEMTLALAKLFSRTGDLIQIYSSPEAFAEALARAAA